MRVAALLSGGVDSTIAALLSKEQGYDVTAFYIKIWLEDELSFLGSCPWEEDLAYARAVCEKWNIPLEIISLQKEYHACVVDYTLSQVKAGKTPNPDILCNSEIKFGVFYDHVGRFFDKIVTGHYAQSVVCAGTSYLCMSADVVKDQTYFLAQVSQDRLQSLMFPIGGFTKEQVRAFAQIYNTPNKDRKDSQGICFLGRIKYSDFLKYHLGTQKGDLIEWETKNKVGTHHGYWFYTRGQRQGIGLSGGPWYVVAKDIDANIVYVSKNYALLGAMRTSLVLYNVQWLVDRIYAQNILTHEFGIKLRHGPHMHRARLREQIGCGSEMRLVIDLMQPDQGIAPGQYGVLYHQGVCLGGGIICES
jgi:tRNA-5-taurinomethyluridine 2-sulfurtransferase